MRVSNLRLAALALTSGLALGGCAYGFGDPYGSYGSLGVGYGNYGYGYGDGYGGYGYGGYPYGGYGYGGYPYGGYGSSYGYGFPFGWYDNYYYPGSGIYVYDRDRHRRVMTDAQRQYWRDKFARYHSGSATTTATTNVRTVTPRENWSGFDRIRTRGSDSNSSSTNNSNRGHAWGRQSTTTSSSGDATTTTRSNNGWRGRGHDRSNEQ